MKTHFVAATTAILLASGTAFASDDAESLFKEYKCAACHEIDGENAGPSLKEIAARYAGDQTAQARLEQKTRTGGAGSFGTLPMPATPMTVSDADIKTLVKWILSCK